MSTAYHVYNPLNKPEEELPIIYGFNNGGNPGFYSAIALAESGHDLAGHICSTEGWMPLDLGFHDAGFIHKREHYRQHYPEGYRTIFLERDELSTDTGFLAAIERNKELYADQTQTEQMSSTDVPDVGT